MSMQSIRERYHVPAKRGMTVRNPYIHDQLGEIVSVSKSPTRLNVRVEGGNKYSLHPFELDYLVDGEWVLGCELRKLHGGE